MPRHCTPKPVQFKLLDFIADRGYCVDNEGNVWTRRSKRIVRDNKGRIVRSIPILSDTWKKMKQNISSRGYHLICLWSNKKMKTCLVHRLVLLAFIGPCPQGMECRHLDGNKDNNNLDNLRWGTCDENVQDRIDHNRTCPGEKNVNAKLTWKEAEEIRQIYAAGGISQRKLANKYGVNKRAVWNIVNNKGWIRK